MPRFKPYSYAQTKMSPVDFSRQLQPGTFEFALNQMVDDFDLSLFDYRFQNDDTGAPAYDPAILLKIVLFAYARGITSSRQIARACRENPDKLFRKRDPDFADAGRHKRPIDRKGTKKGKKYFSADDFTFDPVKGKLICPAGKELFVKNRNFKTHEGYHGIAYMSKKTDCRVCALRKKCLRNPKSVVRQVTKFEGRGDTRSYTEQMIERFETPRGRFLYSRRLGIVEPVFGNICHALGLKRFSLRGKAKVDTQWKLIGMVHNVMKLVRFAPRFAPG